MLTKTRNLDEEIEKLEKRAKERLELLEMRGGKTIDELLESVSKSEMSRNKDK